MEVDFMKKAYGILYEIENLLRYSIEDTMSKEYGNDWFLKAPLTMKYQLYKKSFSSFYYHELISLIKGYPCFTTKFNSSAIIQLQETIPIRNKIAHCKALTQEEYDKLEVAHYATKMSVLSEVIIKLKNKMVYI
ncbi:6-phospho-beta-glucosidase [Oceanobacillus picturae]|uniref:6-phospho-beta-glucosidase n=1 Tax=Oceanobacillus picturae TaxID=171693 RepID=A0A0U9H8U2_9BACI|nr:Swt1 family HEPN domain-containing protein [Oceanobacillus picturae]GAQ19130.1 6-phospho-beta-glucosidase [Oceanobacillus picturae]